MTEHAFTIIAGAVLTSVAHAWLGRRYLLPRLVALPEFAEVVAPTPRVRWSLGLAWYACTLGLLVWAVFLVNVESIVRHQQYWPFIVAAAILLTPSPLMVGSYLGLLLRSRTRHLGTWFTVAVWAVLVVVVVAAWRAAAAGA